MYLCLECWYVKRRFSEKINSYLNVIASWRFVILQYCKVMMLKFQRLIFNMMNKKVLDTWKPMQFNWNFSKRVFFVFINVDCEYEIMTFHVIYAQIKKGTCRSFNWIFKIISKKWCNYLSFMFYVGLHFQHYQA